MALGDLPIVGGMLGGFSGGGALNFMISILIAGSILGLIFGGFWWWFKAKRIWNLKVEFKMPRSGGNLVMSEWGKGQYDSKKGVVYVKRKGLPKSPLEPFDVKEFLQGSNTLTVVQIGINQYLPVLPTSYDQVTNEQGEVAVVMKVKGDISQSKSWRSSFEREAKNAYSLSNLLKENTAWIAIGLVIFLWGIQFLVIYNAVK